MRYDSEHKAETRERVLRAAAREIRAKGPDGVAVAGVMKQAGLTHGGFYAHFASKDALVEAALDTMFDGARHKSDALSSTSDPRAALAGYIDFYLSPGHRDARGRGCPLPALSGDLARSEGPARTRFGAGVEGLRQRLARLLEHVGIADAQTEATALLAQLVGAVTLARAVADASQSDAILAATATSLARKYALVAA